MVKHHCAVFSSSAEFESHVVSDSGQTSPLATACSASFESHVVSDSGQTADLIA